MRHWELQCEVMCFSHAGFPPAGLWTSHLSPGSVVPWVNAPWETSLSRWTGWFEKPWAPEIHRNAQINASQNQTRICLCPVCQFLALALPSVSGVPARGHAFFSYDHVFSSRLKPPAAQTSKQPNQISSAGQSDWKITVISYCISIKY